MKKIIKTHFEIAIPEGIPVPKEVELLP